MKTTFTISVKPSPLLLATDKTAIHFSKIFVRHILKNFCNTALLLVSFFSILFFTQDAKANFTVPAGTIVRADTLSTYSGVLTINGTLNLTSNTVLNGFTSVVINAPNGQIYWTNNSDLFFASGTTIVIKEAALGLRPGGGNSSQRLWIGSTLMAVANNNSGPAALSFTDINLAGGVPEFTLAVSAVSNCYGTALTATLMPLNTNINYDCTWSVDNPGVISPATESNFNTARLATITPANLNVGKVYTIFCNVYKAGDKDAITSKTISVTVNPLPPVPSLVTASPTSICMGSASKLTASSPGNTIEWYTADVGGTPVGTSASATNYAVNPSETTKYYAGSLINETGCRSLSRVATTTVTVSAVSVGGNMNGNATVCTGMNNTILTINDYTGSITRWESSTDNFATINNLANNSAALTTTNLTTSTSYRAIVTSGVCTPATSSIAVLKVSDEGKWLGVNTDWNSSLNWCNGAVPAPTSNIMIDSGLLYYPVITGNVYVDSLSISPGAVVTVKGSGVLKIGGGINSINGIDATEGIIEMNGVTPQTILASNFVFEKVAKLIVSNTTSNASPVNPSVAISANGGILKISGAIAFGNVNNAVLQTNDNLTLLSTSANTAMVEDITNNNLNSNNAVAGKVSIERYLTARRAWRFLTAPISAASNVTISAAWQEGAAVTDPRASTLATDPFPGYGTQISYGYPVANPGYDLNITGNASIKYFTTTGLNGTPATTNTVSITDVPAYLLFIRGNRSTQLSLGTSAPPTPTILRAKGFINSGLTNVGLPPGYKSGSSNFRVFKNPYPAAIDFHKIMQNTANSTAGFTDAFYVWDANLGGPAGIGGWVVLSYNNFTGRYDKNVASSVDASGSIQSGSAVLIDYNGTAGNIVVRESDKSVTSNISMFRSANAFSNIRTSLLGRNADNSTYLIDAAMVSFDEANSNEIDNRDMKKMENFEESFSLVSNGNLLAIERRKPVLQTDTIFCNVTKMKQQNYQLLVEMESVNVPKGTSVYLEDLFLNTKSPVNINAATAYAFSIDTSTLSSSPTRFRLVFNLLTDSVKLRMLKGNTLNNAVTANSNAEIINDRETLSVFPNPVFSNSIRLKMNETTTGFYTVRLFNKAGEILANKVIHYSGGKSIQTIEASRNLLNGSYQLQVISPDNKSTTLSVIVQKK